MCGRFALTRMPVAAWAETLEMPAFEPPPPRYNIAPGQYVLTILRDPEIAHPIPQMLEWGLLPAWAKTAAGATRPINARAETAAEKPSFRAALRHRRCLVPADGYYEWSGQGAERQPWLIRRRDRRPFAFAGLWERWQGPGDHFVDSFAILTTAANAALARLHPRMPVIINNDCFNKWLDPGTQSARAVTPWLTAAPDNALEAIRVSRRVNSVRHDDPACQAIADVPTLPGF